MGTAEEGIQRQLTQERARLEEELGLKSQHQHFKRPAERPFLKSERATTTILVGGLTVKHERLVQGALEGMGYNIGLLPTPDVKAFQTGKEFGNNGQCNPTYFTVGNLVKFLQEKRDHEQVPVNELLEKFVFVTAGACGPCRFGMYEAEYRLALRNSGFEGFRVILFQQKGGLSQSDVESGLEMSLDFFLSILNAMNVGDILNDIAYQIRPFEVNVGETDRVLEEGLDSLCAAMKSKEHQGLSKRLEGLLAKTPGLRSKVKSGAKFLHQLRTSHYVKAVEEVVARFDAIDVDFTRVKPMVKVTGEFWAQTTEGDGNFNMFRFLEKEGAQVLVEPIATWILYMLWQTKMHLKDRRGLSGKEKLPGWSKPFQRAGIETRLAWKLGRLSIAEKIFVREYERLRTAARGLPHHLSNQYELQRLGHPFYNSKAAGGEGHMEVAKNIYYTNKSLAHMVLSLKPFGCMPSTQSDGAQAAVVSIAKDMIFLPVETSGEGEVNAHSRVQMALGEARVKAKEEFARTMECTRYSLDDIRAYVEKHPEFKRPFLKIPKTKGVVGVAANFVRHVTGLMEEARWSARPSVPLNVSGVPC